MYAVAPKFAVTGPSEAERNVTPANNGSVKPEIDSPPTLLIGELVALLVEFQCVPSAVNHIFR